MPAEIRLPYSRSAAQPAGNGTWRKRVLPVGKINYQGRVLTFDKDYLTTLASSFQASAYDQVPFQLADKTNSHTNDPERFRGTILGVDVKDDGLWVTMKPTEAGNKLLMTNPNLGVSARIVEDYARADGKYFPAAIQHVLGTLDPRITGLGSWESVEMSNTPDMIIDLSAAEFAGEEGGITMPELSPDKLAKLNALLELDPETLAALTDGLADISAADDGEPNEDELVAAINSMSEDEFALVAAEYIEPEPVLAGAGAQFSNGDDYDMNALEMANYRIAENERQMSVLQGEHDKQAFENEKRRFANLGVPPFITELARPLLEGTGHAVELSNGSQVDAGLVMRKVLQEYGRQVSLLDLSGEMGSSMDEPEQNEASTQARDNILGRFRSQTGI